MHHIVESDLPAWCDWLNIKLEGTPTLLSPVFVAEKREADLLIQTGDNRLLHVEYIREPEPDVFARMISYRAHIMRTHLTASLTQYAIVLGNGTLHTHDDPENGFFLGLNTIRLPDVDPQEFLSRPGLAPLAELAQGNLYTRTQSAAAAVRAIRTLPRERQPGMLESLLSLATITLDPSSIDLIAEEINVTVESVAEFYSATKMGQLVHEQGREQGLEQGLEQGMSAVLVTLLEQRFDHDPRLPAIAARMAHGIKIETSIKLIHEADSVDDLLSRLAELQT